MKLLTFLFGCKSLLGVLLGEDVLDVNALLCQGLGGGDFPKEYSSNFDILSLLEMGAEGLNLVHEAIAETKTLGEEVE